MNKFFAVKFVYFEFTLIYFFCISGVITKSNYLLNNNKG